MKKRRLDVLVAARGLAESREKAQRLILAGEVLVDDAPAGKPGHEYPEDCAIRVRHPERYVGRGGLKLDGAFESFAGFDPTGLVCADVGASTGGFTDCLLQHGAAKVYAIDVGHGLLHPRIANDPRVVVMDGVNARNLQAADLPEAVDCAVTDVSFISLKLILPAIDHILRPGGQVVALIKPQFEAGREDVGRGGVVRDEAVRARVVEEIRAFGTGEVGWEWLACRESPIKGPAGNVEFLSWWRKEEGGAN